jgi:hypothetical protein
LQDPLAAELSSGSAANNLAHEPVRELRLFQKPTIFALQHWLSAGCLVSEVGHGLIRKLSVALTIERDRGSRIRCRSSARAKNDNANTKAA